MFFNFQKRKISEHLETETFQNISEHLEVEHLETELMKHRQSNFADNILNFKKL